MTVLQDKVCIITGGAGSIGVATAQTFLEQGGKVMLADFNEELLQQQVTRLQQEYSADRVMQCLTDVSSTVSVKLMIDQVVSRWGSIDVVFSNAGNFGTVAPIDSYPEDVFDSVYSVHVKGAFLVCQHAVPHINEGGSIIITSSVAGMRGDPGVYAYITAKHAQVGLMRCLAKELAPKRIRVNSIHPGPIDNGFQHAVEADLSKLIERDGGEFFDEQTPMGRHGSATEIAQSVLFLASEQSSYTTGITLLADGGMSI